MKIIVEPEIESFQRTVTRTVRNQELRKLKFEYMYRS